MVFGGPYQFLDSFGSVQHGNGLYQSGYERSRPVPSLDGTVMDQPGPFDISSTRRSSNLYKFQWKCLVSYLDSEMRQLSEIQTKSSEIHAIFQ